MADRVEGNDFWIKRKPYLVGFAPDSQDELYEIYREELADYETIEARLGWRVAESLSFCAMCNDDDDHANLAMLCLHFAKLFDGMIAFGGSLDHYTRDRALLGLPGVFLCEGQHVFGPAVLEAWTRHADFRMVK